MFHILAFVSVLAAVLGQDPSCSTCSSQDPDTVCARDGMVYANECEAKCKGKGVECKGVCPCNAADNCFCGALFRPVCGESGQNFDNKCKAKCAKEPVACDGKCPCSGPSQDVVQPPGGSQVCEALDRPVCGDDGQTYSNDCLARQKGVFVKCEGQCPCDNTKNCDYCCGNVDGKQCTRIRPNCSGCPTK
eukprot:maker-scaffold939_size78603-snap-gene-0.7 protein:Tk11929 transcript:maker-scaffold939_size78603-snap-gene-0.7-mRNA-1 annotation:"serine protease inhibitor-1l"